MIAQGASSLVDPLQHVSHCVGGHLGHGPTCWKSTYAAPELGLRVLLRSSVLLHRLQSAHLLAQHDIGATDRLAVSSSWHLFEAYDGSAIADVLAVSVIGGLSR